MRKRGKEKKSMMKNDCDEKDLMVESRFNYTSISLVPHLHFAFFLEKLPQVKQVNFFLSPAYFWL